MSHLKYFILFKQTFHPLNPSADARPYKGVFDNMVRGMYSVFLRICLYVDSVKRIEIER